MESVSLELTRWLLRSRALNYRKTGRRIHARECSLTSSSLPPVSPLTPRRMGCISQLSGHPGHLRMIPVALGNVNGISRRHLRHIARSQLIPDRFYALRRDAQQHRAVPVFLLFFTLLPNRARAINR